jgi:tetratricopeptide (TPR) repeat protein
MGRGVARAKAGRVKQAIADQSEAIRIEPGLAAAFRNRGRDHWTRGAVKSALGDFTEAIRLEPQDAGAYCDRATVYNRLGKFALAIADANEGIRLAPEFHLGHSARGFGFLGRGRQRAFTFWRRGNAEARKADFRQAVTDFTDAIRLLPVSWDCYHGRAAAYHLLGDHASAAKDEASVPRAGQLP